MCAKAAGRGPPSRRSCRCPPRPPAPQGGGSAHDAPGTGRRPPGAARRQVRPRLVVGRVGVLDDVESAGVSSKDPAPPSGDGSRTDPAPIVWLRIHTSDLACRRDPDHIFILTICLFLSRGARQPMCTLRSAPPRSFVAPGRLLAGPGASAGVRGRAPRAGRLVRCGPGGRRRCRARPRAAPAVAVLARRGRVLGPDRHRCQCRAHAGHGERAGDRMTDVLWPSCTCTSTARPGGPGRSPGTSAPHARGCSRTERRMCREGGTLDTGAALVARHVLRRRRRWSSARWARSTCRPRPWSPRSSPRCAPSGPWSR